MNETTINAYAGELHAALRNRRPVPPLTERSPDVTIDDAYRISRRLLERRLADGETLIGKKTGVTSKPVQTALGVHQPDFGYLTDTMLFDDGAELPIGECLIQPRAEGEIAFILGADLVGPGITPEDVLGATELVRPCFEIVDSRIQDWKIRIQDTIADNASSGLFLLGKDAAAPGDIDFVTCGMVVYKNGEVLSTGAGAAALGSPVNCVAWLANALGAWGVPLKAGEIILSGSLVPLEPVVPGDEMTMRIGGIGSARARFV